MNIICEEQGTKEWFDCRMGCLTGSRVAAALAVRKKGNGDLQSRIDMRLELAVERVTNKPTENFVTEWMARGIELEPLARAAYELRTGTETEQTGFVLHESIQWAGCSPDGFLAPNGMVQFKVPKRGTHASYLLGEVVPEEYQPQMLWEMAVCGRQWSDFVSYCPDFPEPLDLFICRLPRDDKRIAEMEAEAVKFLAEVETTVLHLRGGLEAVLEESIGDA
jgi:putative phage-type endonuclease